MNQQAWALVPKTEPATFVLVNGDYSCQRFIKPKPFSPFSSSLFEPHEEHIVYRHTYVLRCGWSGYVYCADDEVSKLDTVIAIGSAMVTAFVLLRRRF